MSAFKPKRISGADLAKQISGVTADLPSQNAVTHTPEQAPRIEPHQEVTRTRPPPTVQVNFKTSEALASLIALEAEKAGSTRRFFARLLRDAGYSVPEADISPPTTKRRWSS